MVSPTSPKTKLTSKMILLTFALLNSNICPNDWPLIKPYIHIYRFNQQVFFVQLHVKKEPTLTNWNKSQAVIWIVTSMFIHPVLLSSSDHKFWHLPLTDWTNLPSDTYFQFIQQKISRWPKKGKLWLQNYKHTVKVNFYFYHAQFQLANSIPVKLS